jgi:hypothetical protein
LIEQLDRLYWLKKDERGVGRRATAVNNGLAEDDAQQHRDTDTNSTA